MVLSMRLRRVLPARRKIHLVLLNMRLRLVFPAPGKSHHVLLNTRMRHVLPARRNTHHVLLNMRLRRVLPARDKSHLVLLNMLKIPPHILISMRLKQKTQLVTSLFVSMVGIALLVQRAFQRLIIAIVVWLRTPQAGNAGEK